MILIGRTRAVNGSCMLMVVSSTQRRVVPMSIDLRFSQEQFAILMAALGRAIESTTDSAAEALKKHNLARYRKLANDAKSYDAIKQLIDVQLDHHQGGAR